MTGKHRQRGGPSVEDVLAYLAVLLVVGTIFELLPSSVTTGVVWGILWRSVAVLAFVITPAIVGAVTLVKYIRLSKQS